MTTWLSWFAPGVCLGLVGTCIVAGQCDAQDRPSESMPLTVRPHDMTLGARTLQAGEHQLEYPAHYTVYVPEQCVGTRRCPLVVFLSPGAETAEDVVHHWSRVSDTYGTILLAATSLDDWPVGDERTFQRNVDTAMKQVLAQYAIDPDRIALVASSASVTPAVDFGGHRLDLFSRIILGSGGFDTGRVDSRNTTTQFLLTEGLPEGGVFFREGVQLKRAGHPVKEVTIFSPHGGKTVDWDMMGHWLQDSWAVPPVARPASRVITRSLPLLTAKVITQMTTFWKRFMDEPDSIRTAARLAHLREVVVPVARSHVSVFMVDMPALAAQYPSVAADLKAAGLTAQQHEAYRIALLNVNILDHVVKGRLIRSMWGYTWGNGPLGQTMEEKDRKDAQAWKVKISINAASVQGKNLQFADTHKGLFLALASTGMWSTP